MQSLSFPLAAFTAGLVSFLSPCVLPLMPGYVSMISGLGIQELRERKLEQSRSVMLHAALFVTGFSIVFVAFGAAASSAGQFAGTHLALLNRIAGAIIILFGLHLTGLLAIKSLYADKRFHALSSGNGWAHAFVLGFAFAFGWTPCVGPILAGILALAASDATLTKGIWLLGFYSLGLAVPFLMTAAGIERFLFVYDRFKPYLRKVEVVGGVLMIAIGTLVFTRHLTVLNSWLNGLPVFRSMAEQFL
jgi:cytochrome c-type biogenesis protein